MNTTLTTKASYGPRQNASGMWSQDCRAQSFGFWAGVASLVDISGTTIQIPSQVEIRYGFEEDARQIGRDFKAAVDYEIPETIKIKRVGKRRFGRKFKVRHIVSRRSDRSPSRRPAESV